MLAGIIIVHITTIILLLVATIDNVSKYFLCADFPQTLTSNVKNYQEGETPQVFQWIRLVIWELFVTRTSACTYTLYLKLYLNLNSA